MNAIQKVVETLGSQRELARKAGATQQAVSVWLKNGKPGDLFTIAVARAVEFKVTPHELRPDLYPHPDDGLPPELRAPMMMGATDAAGELRIQEVNP